jgi:apolipoprotein N-acyltransferase
MSENRLRLIGSLLGGVLLALAFPLPGWSGLAWVAPGILLLVASGDLPPKRVFGIGYLYGLAFALVSLRWLQAIPFPVGAAAAYIALSAYVALYPALWVWLCWRTFPGARVPPALPVPNVSHEGVEEIPETGASVSPFQLQLQQIGQTPWHQKTLWSLGCGALWVAVEYTQGRFLSGFPWNPLGASQYTAVPLLQVASVTGAYGVSFLVAWGSACIYLTAVRLYVQATGLPPGKPNPSRRFTATVASTPSPLLASWRFSLFTDLGLPLLVVSLVCFVGALKVVSARKPDRFLKMALIQPSIPQKLIFDPNETTNRFKAILELSELALAAKPDVLVWPEASLPTFNEDHFRALTNLIVQQRVYCIFGADDAEPNPEAKATSKYLYYNAAFLFGPDGGFAATYRKQRLVIFGEYVPFEGIFPFMRYLTPVESFTPGRTIVPFPLSKPKAQIQPIICFEDVFPHFVRQCVTTNTDIVLNLTNDGWFGEGSEQWQHAAMAVFRSVENGVPLVRCANNGMTCWIDRFGRIRDAGFGETTDIYKAGFRVVQVPLLGDQQSAGQTFYHHYGDVFAVGCGVYALFGLFRGTMKRRVKRVP